MAYSGQYSVNPLAGVSFRGIRVQLPAVPGLVARLSWRTDRCAVQLLLLHTDGADGTPGAEQTIDSTTAISQPSLQPSALLTGQGG
ncbi:hypothetical protein EES42_34440 [Streptomyces sp. ADI95-17]|nr:hypothetical protein EES42_34440 [Streptomyces sp. ADI95-17]